MCRNSKNGSVLILSFWVLFFLAALTVASAGHVWAVLQAAERLMERADARIEASSVAAWAVGNLEKTLQNFATNQWDGISEDAWNRSEEIYQLPPRTSAIRTEGYVYFVSPDNQDPVKGLIGEEGRLDLNHGLNERLIALFSYLGGDSGREVAETLFVDRDASEVGLTAGREAGYDLFTSVEDLLLVDGIDTALFKSISPHVTVYSKGNIINANTASAAVWAAFLLSTGDKNVMADADVIVDKIIKERERGGFGGAADFSSRLSEVLADYPVTASQLWGMGLTERSSVFRGIATSSDLDSGMVLQEIEFVWDAEENEFMLWREL